MQVLAGNSNQLNLKNLFERPTDESEHVQGDSLPKDVFIASEHVGQTATAVMSTLLGVYTMAKVCPEAAPVAQVVVGGIAGYQVHRAFTGLANAAGNLTTHATNSAAAGRAVRIGLKFGAGSALAQMASPAGALSLAMGTIAFGLPVHGLARLAKDH